MICRTTRRKLQEQLNIITDFKVIEIESKLRSTIL
uniref:Uncharacterized protein n=1 Tax=Manihot esculenta TaxID=3983 RepID=A0A2C9WI86_MANES